MMIQAIETNYKGYRFRSRLEARWAVFLDETGIGWEYEPQGIKVKTPTGRINYLPDFWLDTGQWGEVKGFLDSTTIVRMWSIAVGLTQCGKGNDQVVLGNIPRQGSALWAVQLHAHGNILYGAAWDPTRDDCALKRPHVKVLASESDAKRLCEGFPFGAPDWALPGLARARAARFEWGEHG
jgi:hypothetical protein